MRYRVQWSRVAPFALAVAALIAASQVGTAGRQAPVELDYGVYRQQVEPILLTDRGVI